MRNTLSAAVTLFFCAMPALPALADPLINRGALREFVDEMAAEHGFNTAELTDLFRQIRPRPDVIAAIANPMEAKPWHEYRPLFVNERTIRDGQEFWGIHEETLARAESVYGVASQIIVAILGVETRYGRTTGFHPVLESLTTLAFGYPPRSRFFREELKEYLLLTRTEGLKPLSVTGSYAGAMGPPQFTASSYRRYAVDFNGDGRRDLLHNIADGIGSVANYLRAHGWKPRQAVASRARITGKNYKSLLKHGPRLRLPLRRLREYGVTSAKDFPDGQLATLIALETERRPEYWIGLHNFHVLIRYNPSTLYAMAVHQLSQEILTARSSIKPTGE